jgi:hypothetical protein
LGTKIGRKIEKYSRHSGRPRIVVANVNKNI